jgi:hypothetical protein
MAFLGLLGLGLGPVQSELQEVISADPGYLKSGSKNPKYWMSGHPQGCAPSEPQAFLEEV